MIFDRNITVVDSHTAGEPYRLVTGGIPPIKGNTMSEKLKYFIDNYDSLRTGLMHEPRGHSDMFGGILTEPVSSEADFGIIFMEGAGYLNMCGHGTIATVTIILETGLLKMEYPETCVTLDTPAGLVKCIAKCENNKVISVSLVNVPSFLYKRDLPVEIDGKEYKVDIAFGGSFFCLINEKELMIDISVENLPELKSFAEKFEQELNNNDKYEFKHPLLPHIKTVDLIEIYKKLDGKEADAQNVVIFGGSVDRSPCGTGTSAKLSTLYAKGELKEGEVFKYASVIGSVFQGKIIGTTKVGEFDAVIPEITGSAYIYGFNNLVWDKHDPYYAGFRL
ncbi:MAG: proline racemase family protein [Lachnospirales bacterium]